MVAAIICRDPQFADIIDLPSIIRSEIRGIDRSHAEGPKWQDLLMLPM